MSEPNLLCNMRTFQPTPREQEILSRCVSYTQYEEEMREVKRRFNRALEFLAKQFDAELLRSLKFEGVGEQ